MSQSVSKVGIELLGQLKREMTLRVHPVSEQIPDLYFTKYEFTSPMATQWYIELANDQPKDFLLEQTDILYWNEKHSSA